MGKLMVDFDLLALEARKIVCQRLHLLFQSVNPGRMVNLHAFFLWLLGGGLDLLFEPVLECLELARGYALSWCWLGCFPAGLPWVLLKPRVSVAFLCPMCQGSDRLLGCNDIVHAWHDRVFVVFDLGNQDVTMFQLRSSV